VRKALLDQEALSSIQVAALVEVCAIDRIPFDWWKMRGEDTSPDKIPEAAKHRFNRLPITEPQRAAVLEQYLIKNRILESAADMHYSAGDLLMIYLRVAGQHCLPNGKFDMEDR
jgi:hypothetical protein